MSNQSTAPRGCRECGGLGLHTPSCSLRVGPYISSPVIDTERVAAEPASPCPFKVGDRVRYKEEMRGNWPDATVKEIIGSGFVYEYDKPYVLGTRLGSTTGGQSYVSDHWELVPDAVPQPEDIDHKDSERLRGFCRMTSVEVKAVGMVSAATSLEMIGYIRELEWKLRGEEMP